MKTPDGCKEPPHSQLLPSLCCHKGPTVASRPVFFNAGPLPLVKKALWGELLPDFTPQIMTSVLLPQRGMQRGRRAGSDTEP